MRELYDPVRTEALFREAREIIAALDSELKDLAVQIHSAFDDVPTGGGLLAAAAAPRAIALPASKREVSNRSFWKFWR